MAKTLLKMTLHRIIVLECTAHLLGKEFIHLLVEYVVCFTTPWVFWGRGWWI